MFFYPKLDWFLHPPLIPFHILSCSTRIATYYMQFPGDQSKEIKREKEETKQKNNDRKQEEINR